jgi:hypothetical protein
MINVKCTRLMSPSQLLHNGQNILQGNFMGDPQYRTTFNEVQVAWQGYNATSSQRIAISQNIFKVQDGVSYLSMAAMEKPSMLALDVFSI